MTAAWEKCQLGFDKGRSMLVAMVHRTLWKRDVRERKETRVEKGIVVR